MSYGHTFALWREAAGPDWSAYTEHDFVKGLGDGTLPQAAFLHYLKQDYLFLTHFARGWALAMTKAETLEEQRHCAATAHALIGEEITLHVSVCAAHGVSEDELASAEERLENLAYTRYVLDAGQAGGFLDMLAALAPCVLGYGKIGTRLAQDATSETYGQWIETYAGPEYQTVCQQVGALIDAAIERRLGSDPEVVPIWNGLCTRFCTATRLEVGFWDMGLAP